eukprot:TRINITY_DN47078_c0_g1_i1.p1 TRINITY_DN47078_c0_g1~~TRINITY_DN47078_c0_g1_i1.p1  ORF type:complete len:871 (-),score=231.18 TRINITY_DN47078_c0_g1_i1:39-2651(-)
MAPKAAAASLKTESGLAQLNELLADRSYVGGTSEATAEDMARFSELQSKPDRHQFPHLLRWYNHIAGLRARYAGYHVWPGEQPKAAAAGGEAGKKNPRAAGKEKQALTFDCQVTTITNRRQVEGDDSINTGAGAKCFPSSSSGSKGRYYITTAINYCNGWPHIGHAYEALTSDVFARYHRLLGQDVFYMTGADEHGQKIAQTAEGENLSPIEICDRYCMGFRALNQRLAISNDFYVRTTEDRHKAVARAMWQKCKANGDIYLDRYEGWYLVREERYITDQEAQEWDYKDPSSGVPLKKMSEPSFFFKLSKYQKKVIQHIEEHAEFIQPIQYRTELMERLKSIELRDLSISRGTFEWGVECPEEAVDGKKHVMYVWFDALINYVSGVDGHDSSKPLSRFWPADMHIVGKDITWFHCVIWPSMLMSAGMKLPKSVVTHGFISGSDGRKMSKSFGNVVDPHDMLDKVPCDTLRWYLCREAAYGDDVKFSEDSLRLMHNAELCDNLGNLVNRAVSLCGGSVPESKKLKDVTLPFDLKELKSSVRQAFEAYRLSEAAELTVRAAAATNKWIAGYEPWKMKDADKQELRATCLRLLLEAVYVLAHFFGPFIPTAAEAIFKKVGEEPRPIDELKDNFQNLTAGKQVTSSSVLFGQLEVQKVDVEATAAQKAENKKAQKEATPKAEAKGKADAKKKEKPKVEIKDDPNQPLFTKLEVRVGKIVKAWNHPKADRLFVEEIDVGDPDGPRQVISGLREHYSLEEFTGKRLLVICNLMPAKMMGVTSHGMVLCAKNPEKKVVELISVPESCAIGDRVLPEGLPSSWKPFAPEAVKELKVWESIVKDLRTDSGRVACFGGVPLTTEKGERFLAPTLPEVELG